MPGDAFEDQGQSHDQRIKKGNPRIDSIDPGFFLSQMHKGDYEMRMLTVMMLGIMILSAGLAAAETADFEDLALAAESFYNGSDGAGSFESRSAVFNNLYDDSFFIYWEGFSYSNTTDTTTEGYINQYSAYPGSGAEGSTVYGVAYQPGYYGYGTVPTIAFPEEISISSVSVANTTYAYLTMKKGDIYGFTEKFGGDTGDDEDWFLLTITGKDADGNVTGTVEFYLADYRFVNNEHDYIVDDWIRVDLSNLGEVKSIEFALTSSDTDPDPTIGMNTPSYFAVDNIVYYDTDGSDSSVSLGCFINLLSSVLK
jgi:hypothetical protein